MRLLAREVLLLIAGRLQTRGDDVDRGSAFLDRRVLPVENQYRPGGTAAERDRDEREFFVRRCLVYDARTLVPTIASRSRRNEFHRMLPSGLVQLPRLHSGRCRVLRLTDVNDGYLGVSLRRR